MNDAPPPASPSDKLGEELFHARHHALIRAILDNISEGVSISEASGNFIYSNPFASRVFGVGESERSVSEEWSSRYGIFLPDERTPLPIEQMPIWKALKGQESGEVELFIRNAGSPDGIHVSAKCIPVQDQQGRLLGAMALVRDVDTQRRIEEEKRRTEQHFRLLVETAQEGIGTIDPEWRITYANRYMAEMFGYRVEEMLGMHLSSFMDEKAWQVAQRGLSLKGRAPPVKAQDTAFLRKDGTVLWTSMSTTPLFNDEGGYAGSLAMLTDITRRREAEAQVRQLNADLEGRIAQRTSQLEFSHRELESFAYTVAHDLRAPLRSISSFSQALVEDCGDKLDEVGRDYVRRIVNGGRRMAELIDGILQLSRVNSTPLSAQACDLSRMARGVIEQLQSEQPERIVKVNIQEGLIDQGDPNLLRAVLENLLGNAWKFTRERDVAEIEFRATGEAGGARTYTVRDNGAGFNMAYREKLFGVFQRLHTQREFEGNGVGLATVQRIIRRHGGRIWGEGQPGQGASFFFTLNEFPRPPRTTASPSDP
ncbi:sensor histidine kinase [Hyalangium rubrum]|uniref:histidine kinase n=1 Tax=Hyalangium rubrum TaxID=3103134 RepID=A0ABU5H506_9BACT|nr:PAS domain S-box protein [Hyalangium sp. s54d21]MDY7228202.1 PAS domain S-box protein [Hyalangium sp. s54d21]